MEIAMTKRSPDKREQNRLKKIENEKQRKRYLAALCIKDGCSLRDAARKVGMSTYFVSEWRDRLLDHKVVRRLVKGRLRDIDVYTWKPGFKSLLGTKKPGPKPGNCPKT